jgi:hypothetical protein
MHDGVYRLNSISDTFTYSAKLQDNTILNDIELLYNYIHVIEIDLHFNKSLGKIRLYNILFNVT